MNISGISFTASNLRKASQSFQREGRTIIIKHGGANGHGQIEKHPDGKCYKTVVEGNTTHRERVNEKGEPISGEQRQYEENLPTADVDSFRGMD